MQRDEIVAIGVVVVASILAILSAIKAIIRIRGGGRRKEDCSSNRGGCDGCSGCK